MGKAKTPALVVVACAVRNPVRLVRDGKEMLLQFRQRKASVNRRAVIDYMQIGLLKIDDAFARGILHVSIANIPLFGNGPIEDAGAARDFAEFQRYAPL